MTTYLHHVTLQTGDVYRSERSEAGDDVVAVCAELLDAGLGALAPLPDAFGVPLRLRVSRGGRCWLATVHGIDDAPVLMLGIATHSRCGARLWEQIHDHPLATGFATRGHPCPPEPWLASRIEPGVALYTADAAREMMLVLADFSRCLAWAAIERRTQ